MRVKKHLADSWGSILAIRLSLVIGVVVLWEAATLKGVLNPIFFGRPIVIAAYLWEYLADGRLLRAAVITLSETLVGFFFGLALGTATAFGLWWLSQLGRIFERLLVVVNAIPKVTLAPILIVLLGVGIAMKVALAFLNVVIFVALTAYLGMKQADPDLLDLIRANGGTRWQAFRHVVWPSSFAALMIGMKIGISLSFIGAVVGEYLASRDGLGYLAVYGAEIFNMSLVMLALGSLMALALLLFASVQYLERKMLGWRPRV